VSVVATGIEADAVSAPQPAKVFSFPARQPTAAAAPVAAEAVEEETTIEPTAEESDEELLLGADDILTSPVGAPPIAPPDDEDETEAPAATGGGTLFERMSNIARGAPKAQLDEEEGDTEPGFRREPLDIPRFLNRQNHP
jgi:cell division protein FtsZ